MAQTRHGRGAEKPTNGRAHAASNKRRVAKKKRARREKVLGATGGSLGLPVSFSRHRTGGLRPASGTYGAGPPLNRL